MSRSHSTPVNNRLGRVDQKTLCTTTLGWSDLERHYTYSVSVVSLCCYHVIRSGRRVSQIFGRHIEYDSTGLSLASARVKMTQAFLPPDQKNRDGYQQ